VTAAARPNKEEPEPGELSALLIIDPVERDTPFTGRKVVPSKAQQDEIIQVMKDDGKTAIGSRFDWQPIEPVPAAPGPARAAVS